MEITKELEAMNLVKILMVAGVSVQAHITIK